MPSLKVVSLEKLAKGKERSSVQGDSVVGSGLASSALLTQPISEGIKIEPGSQMHRLVIFSFFHRFKHILNLNF